MGNCVKKLAAELLSAAIAVTMISGPVSAYAAEPQATPAPQESDEVILLEEDIEENTLLTLGGAYTLSGRTLTNVLVNTETLKGTSELSALKAFGDSSEEETQKEEKEQKEQPEEITEDEMATDLQGGAPQESVTEEQTEAPKQTEAPEQTEAPKDETNVTEEPETKDGTDVADEPNDKNTGTDVENSGDNNEDTENGAENSGNDSENSGNGDENLENGGGNSGEDSENGDENSGNGDEITGNDDGTAENDGSESEPKESDVPEDDGADTPNGEGDPDMTEDPDTEEETGPETPEESESESETEETEKTEKPIVFNNDEVDITVTVAKGVDLPDDTQVVAEKLDVTSEEYQKAKAAADEATNADPATTHYSFYNVKLVSRSGEINLEEGTVSVQIVFKNIKMEENSEQRVFRIEDEENGGKKAQDITNTATAEGSNLISTSVNV